MPIAALKVREIGQYQQYVSIVGASEPHLAVWDSSGTTHDSDSSYILIHSLAGGSGQVSFRFFDMAEGLEPTSLTINIAAKRDNAANGCTFDFGLFDPAGPFFSSFFSAVLTSSYQVFSGTYTVDPFTGAAWSLDEMRRYEIYLRRPPPITATGGRLTLLSASVDYARVWNSLAPEPYTYLVN